MLRAFWPAAWLLAATAPLPGYADPREEEKVEYLRPAGKDFAPECTFTIKRAQAGWSITSVTGRGDTQITVTARYDAEDHLTAAEALLIQKEQRTSATVAVAGDKATVRRGARPPQEFNVPPGMIVTSAPDWTDIFLLCRRYDRQRGGRQSFAGLWIHPTQAAQRLPFTMAHDGTDRIEKDGKALDLERFTIQIRGPNPYVAWADATGSLVRLVPLPYQDGVPSGLVLKGYEQATRALRPPKR
jgi:hypothetical protein